MGENVRVVVRCRPMNKKELVMKSRSIIKIADCAVTVSNPQDVTAPAKTFMYDNAYDELASTESLYNDICYALVENVLEGYNGTIFAYGQTSCGKSHTMQGPDNSSHPDSSQRGIIPRSFDHIFEAISVVSGIRYLAIVSYLEIYNENIRDLLNPNETMNHALKELPGEGVIVPTLSTHAVHNSQECENLLRLGSRNRATGSTLMNSGSSRSHSIFTISLEHIGEAENNYTTFTGCVRKGKLNLVDLAGSERQNKTGAAGECLREATKINLSLSALGNVISALVDGKSKHIPYRDSKLTRLLQDSLGGNTKTLMIACISPADYNYDETISTLRYASRAKNISNKPIINEDPKDALLREYQEEIMKLKEMLKIVHVNAESLISEPSTLANENLTIEEWTKNEISSKYGESLPLEYVTDDGPSQNRQQEDVAAAPVGDMSTTTLSINPDSIAKSSFAGELLDNKVCQLDTQKRIELIKNALIGGERANDSQLREKHKKKKLAAQRRLSALAHVLSRVEQNEDRDLLQGHYTNIQHELNAKNECLKSYRQKVKALEREVSDLQAEFQLDRADYLESIRRLERNTKFYQQLLEMALPILRKDGKYWDIDEILHNSTWNDDLRNWKLPQSSMNIFRLPRAVPITFSSNLPNYIESSQLRSGKKSSGREKGEQKGTVNENLDNTPDDEMKKMYNESILNNYFRPNRQRLFNTSHQGDHINKWKRFLGGASTLKSASGNQIRVFSSCFGSRDNNFLMNRTWGGVNGKVLITAPQNDSSEGDEDSSKVQHQCHRIQPEDIIKP